MSMCTNNYLGEIFLYYLSLNCCVPGLEDKIVICLNYGVSASFNLCGVHCGLVAWKVVWSFVDCCLVVGLCTFLAGCWLFVGFYVLLAGCWLIVGWLLIG